MLWCPGCYNLLTSCSRLLSTTRFNAVESTCVNNLLKQAWTTCWNMREQLVETCVNNLLKHAWTTCCNMREQLVGTTLFYAVPTSVNMLLSSCFMLFKLLLFSLPPRKSSRPNTKIHIQYSLAKQFNKTII